MMKEIYDMTESEDDIRIAFRYNGFEKELVNIQSILAEVCGANDEYSWYWILQMKDGTYAHATGSCDYTGWDCRSDAEFLGGFKTALDAWENLTPLESGRKNIKRCLLLQLTDDQPFALYDDNC